MADQVSDEELMLRYCSGENSAFDQLYQRHRRPLFRYMLRMINNSAVTEELYQDVWMRIIKQRQHYREQGKFRAWLFRIAHNRIMDHFRSQQPAVHMEHDDSCIQLPHNEAGNPETLALNQEFAGRLVELLHALPPVQREVFLLRQEGDLSLREIAALTESSDEAAKSRLRYALARLRRGLQEFMT